MEPYQSGFVHQSMREDALRGVTIKAEAAVMNLSHSLGYNTSPY